MRLGFAVKVIGRAGLKSNDTRRWQNSPHLSVSLAYLRDILRYLSDSRIGMYRMSSDLAPYATHPGMPQFHTQLEESRRELNIVGAMAKSAGIRLSFHPAQHVVLNSPDETIVAKSVADLQYQSVLLDAMDQGPEAVVITHTGGAYGDRSAARDRFVRNWHLLPHEAQRRVVLENDDNRFAVSDTVWIHARTGIRLVFDTLHHRVYNPERMPARDALAACLVTWPTGERPKVHFSSPRTCAVIEETAGDEGTGRAHRPRWAAHSDYLNPFEFIDFFAWAGAMRIFDVMLEVKLKDVALLQLRRDLLAYAPEIAAQLEPAVQASSPEGNELLHAE